MTTGYPTPGPINPILNDTGGVIIITYVITCILMSMNILIILIIQYGRKL
jgi:hypothetical protein